MPIAPRVVDGFFRLSCHIGGLRGVVQLPLCDVWQLVQSEAAPLQKVPCAELSTMFCWTVRIAWPAVPVARTRQPVQGVPPPMVQLAGVDSVVMLTVPRAVAGDGGSV
jgi:hypothetical protein